ncbi:6842_t:CDS:1, partial [Scutellospora calospora]
LKLQKEKNYTHAEIQPEPSSDKEIKMQTDSSNIVTTSELEENIPNTEKAETASASTKKKKGNKRKLQALNNGIQIAETEATSKDASQSQD